MANGERCRHCGQQESDHEFPDEKTCSLGFKSEFEHKSRCPVLGCDGDCAQTIREAKRVEELKQKAEWDKIQH